MWMTVHICQRVLRNSNLTKYIDGRNSNEWDIIIKYPLH